MLSKIWIEAIKNWGLKNLQCKKQTQKSESFEIIFKNFKIKKIKQNKKEKSMARWKATRKKFCLIFWSPSSTLY